MANIVDIIIKLNDQTQSGLNSVKSGLGQIEQAANAVSGAVFNLRNSIAGVVVGAGIKEAVTQFAQFDDSMRAAGTIAGATGQEYKKMSDLALQMGIDTKFKASEAADAMVKLGYSSFSASEQIKSLPSILDMAAAGGISLSDSASIASNVIRAFSLDASESGRVADVISKAFTSTSTTMGELGEAWKYIAPIAAGLNTNFEELVGTLGILSNAGIKGSMGGTTLRQTMESLLNPTADEAKLMKELGDRIGGAGLIVKTSEGNFVGFASVVRQLEQAGMRADEALKLFGARGGPGMAALLSQGSAAIEGMKNKLDNAGGTAKKIAGDMTAGLGGAITFFKSSVESLFISLGSGLDAPFKQLIYDITTDINSLIAYFKAAKDDGSLEKWMTAGVDALRSFYDTAKSAGIAAFELASKFQPLIEWGIKIAPTFVEVGIAAAGLATSAKIASGALSLLSMAFSPVGTAAISLGTVIASSVGGNITLLMPTFAKLGTAASAAFGAVGNAAKIAGLLLLDIFTIQGASMVAWIAQVQRGSAVVGVLQAASYNLATAFSTVAVAGGALAIGVALGTLINQIPAVQNAMQSLYKFLLDGVTGATESQKAYIDELRVTQNEFQKFSAMEFPDDLAGKTMDELRSLNREVNGGIQYWTAYILELKAAKDQGQDVGNKLKEAEAKLASFREEAGKIKDAIKGYADGYKVELKQAEDAHRNHVQLIKDIAEKQGKEISDAMYKAIDAESDAYKRGEISYEQFENRKKAITEKATNEISAIRLKSAEQISKTSEDQISAEQRAGVRRIALIREQMAAGVVETKVGNDQIAQIETQLGERIKQIKETTGNAVVTEQKKIYQESVKAANEAAKEEEKVAKDSYKSKIEAINTAENMGKISHAEAYKGRLDVEKQYLEKTLSQAQANFEKAKASYKVDSAEFKTALDSRKSALDQYYDKYKEIGDKIKGIEDSINNARLSGEEKARSILQGAMGAREAYADKERQYYEYLQKAQQTAATDQKMSQEYYDKAIAKAGELTGAVEENGQVYQKAGESAQNAANKVTEATNAKIAALKGEQVELRKSADAVKAIPEKLGMTLDTTNVRNGVAVVTGEMAQISGTPVIVKTDPAQLKALEDQLKSVKQQAAIIETKLETAGSQEEADRLKAKLDETNATAQALQAKLDTSQPQQAMSDVGKAADEANAKVASGAKMTLNTDQPKQALGEVEKQTQKIDEKKVDVNVAVKSEGIAEVEAALERIPKVIETQHKIVSTMEASSAKPTTEKLAELESKFKAFGETVEKPLKNTVSAKGDNGQGVTDYIAGIQKQYDQTKSDIESKKIEGNLTIEAEGQAIGAYVGNISDAYTSLFSELTQGAENYSEEWAGNMQKSADSVKKMADDAISSGESIISSLANSIKSLSDQIKKIDEEMAGIGTDTAEKVRNLQKGLMSDLEKYESDKQAARAKYAQAQAELEAGNFENAKKLMLESQSMATSLAREVKDANGNVIVSLADSTAEAISLTRQAGAGATQALAGQKAQLQQQQDAQKAQLEATKQMVDAMKGLASSFSETFTTIMDDFAKRFEESMAKTKEAAETKITPQVDTDPALKALQELQKAAFDQAVQYEKSRLSVIQDAKAMRDSLVGGNTLDFGPALKSSAEAAVTAKKRLDDLNAQLEKLNGKNVNVKLTAEASPRLPMGQTLDNVGTKLKDLDSRLADKKMNVAINAQTGENTTDPTIKSMLGGLASGMGGQTPNFAALQADWTKRGGTEFQKQMMNMMMQAYGGRLAGTTRISDSLADISQSKYPSEIARTGMIPGGMDVKDMGKMDLNIGGKAYPVIGKQEVLAEVKKQFPAMLESTIKTQNFTGVR